MSDLELGLVKVKRELLEQIIRIFERNFIEIVYELDITNDPLEFQSNIALLKRIKEVYDQLEKIVGNEEYKGEKE